MKVIRKNIVTIFLIVSIFWIALLFNSCTIGSGSGSGFNIYPVSEDIRIGKELSLEIKKNPKEYPLNNNSKVKNYLQSIIDEIIKAPEIQYRGVFEYKVEVINDDYVINAFAAPGGYIYVYTGLLKFVDNEATLAAVLAHEVAHAERRHTTQRMSKAYGMKILSDLYMEKNKNQTSELLTNMFTGLSLLSNSREDELEADEYSFKYLKSTKWYPGSIKFFFNKIIGNVGSSGSSFEALLSTHPLPKDRIDAVGQLLKTHQIPPPTEYNTNFRQYQEFIQSIK